LRGSPVRDQRPAGRRPRRRPSPPLLPARAAVAVPPRKVSVLRWSCCRALAFVLSQVTPGVSLPAAWGRGRMLLRCGLNGGTVSGGRCTGRPAGRKCRADWSRCLNA